MKAYRGFESHPLRFLETSRDRLGCSGACLLLARTDDQFAVVYATIHALDDHESCRRGGMADAEDLKSSGGNPVWVRFPPPVLGPMRSIRYATEQAGAKLTFVAGGRRPLPHCCRDRELRCNPLSQVQLAKAVDSAQNNGKSSPEKLYSGIDPADLESSAESAGTHSDEQAVRPNRPRYVV